jgi:hypothetical protein
VRPVSCIEWPRSRISYIDCRSAEGGGYNQDNKSQQYRLNILSSEETEDAHADTQTISASSSVGYEAAMKKHSSHGCKHGSTAPILIRLEGCIKDETEDFLNERPLTQARLSPTRQSRLFEEAISNCNAKKAGFGRKTDR